MRFAAGEGDRDIGQQPCSFAFVPFAYIAKLEFLHHSATI